MGSVGADDHDDPVEEWLRLHARYEYAVRMLLATAAGNRGMAEEFEDTYVDPHFDAIEDQIQAEAERHWAAADEALAFVGDVQQVLVITTPVLFGVGLALVTWFTLVLTRSRRETVAQAERNRQQALHDALTGLPNRTLLRQRADDALTGPDAGAAGPGLLDLGRVKEINDNRGNADGDAGGRESGVEGKGVGVGGGVIIKKKKYRDS